MFLSNYKGTTFYCETVMLPHYFRVKFSKVYY